MVEHYQALLFLYDLVEVVRDGGITYEMTYDTYQLLKEEKGL